MALTDEITDALNAAARLAHSAELSARYGKTEDARTFAVQARDCIERALRYLAERDPSACT